MCCSCDAFTLRDLACGLQMGAEESKSSGSSGCPSFASAAVDFPNSVRREEETAAWTLLHQTTVDKWKDGHAGVCCVGVL